MLRTPILITGCQRSGTTLVNLILDSHPGIWGIDEDRFAFPSIYRYLAEPLPQTPPFVSFKLPQYAHILPFIEMLPKRRILWCIREPLDAVWSMIKLGSDRGVIPWVAHPDGGWLEIVNSYWALNDKQQEQLKDHMMEFSRLTKKFVNISKSSGATPEIDRRDCVFIGALCWRIKNELPSLYSARNIDFHVNSYEDLVTNPKDRIAETLDYIGIEWSDEVLMHHRLHKGMSIGNTSNTRAIDKNSLGAGKKNLSREEQELIKSVCENTAQTWNYTFD